MSTQTKYQRIERITESVVEFFEPVWANWTRKGAVGILAFYTLMAIVGPYLPLPGPYESVMAPDGSYAVTASPDLAWGPSFWLGTTNNGYSVLSQTVYSFRTSLFIGILSAIALIVVGVNIGLVAGYYGGRVERVLMALDDLAYGMPFIPFAIVFVAVFGQGNLMLVAVVGLLLWRGIARVTRSETLSIREREFVKSARASGASDFKIMYYHILPNLIPLLMVYFVFGAVWGILIEAGVSFVGLGDPNATSWGMMLYNVFNAGAFTTAWWWVLPPAFALWLFILSLYIVARALEENVEVQTDVAR